MAAIKQLAAVTRSGTGKGAARSVRREGRVPAVIYGGGLKPEPISVDYKDINKLIYSGHFLTSIFELEVEGRKERVLPRDYQLDVVTDRPVHVDFLRLAAGSRVRIGVPVHVVNREASPGVKKGGAVNLVLHTVEVMAPADAIPESITIDLTGLDFHDSVHVSAVKLPEGCRPVSSKADQTVVTIVPPTVMVEETPAAPRRPPPRRLQAPPRPRLRPAPRPRPTPPRRAAAPAKAAAAPAAAKPRRQEVRLAPRTGGLAPTPSPPLKLIDRGPHAGHRGTRQSRRAPCTQPPQHRLHGGRRDRRGAPLRPVSRPLAGTGGRGLDRRDAGRPCSSRRPT